MELVNHKIAGIPFNEARWIGGEITPTVLILHDTASRLDKGNAAAYLRNNPAKVSCHFVIERDGSVVQQVPTNRRANHAGKSHYHGRRWVNGFSIGIEIVNAGRMTRSAQGARSWFKETYEIDRYDIAEVSTPEHGSGWWMDYTAPQLDAVLQLGATLFAGVPTLIDVRGHWYVSPGRKVDPNPLFPMESVRSQLMGREEAVEDDLVRDAAAVPEGEQLWRVATPGDALNMRRWPSFNPNIITAIPHGTEVLVEREGRFDGRDWSFVRWGGHEGWVVDRYLEEV